mgnify:CR=1 FL=1
MEYNKKQIYLRIYFGLAELMYMLEALEWYVRHINGDLESTILDFYTKKAPRKYYTKTDEDNILILLKKLKLMLFRDDKFYLPFENCPYLIAGENKRKKFVYVLKKKLENVLYDFYGFPELKNHAYETPLYNRINTNMRSGTKSYEVLKKGKERMRRFLANKFKRKAWFLPFS